MGVGRQLIKGKELKNTLVRVHWEKNRGAGGGERQGKAIPKVRNNFELTPELMEEAVRESQYGSVVGEITSVYPQELKFSQTTVSYRKSRVLPDGKKIEYTYDTIKDDLYNNGWPKDKPIDAVIMPPDGSLTSIDNTRLTAARELCIDKNGSPIKPLVRVHKPSDLLTSADAGRFASLRKNYFPDTWGQVTKDRIRSQSGKPHNEVYGLTKIPRVTGKHE